MVQAARRRAGLGYRLAATKCDSGNDPSEIPCRASEMRARTGLYRWSPNGDVRSREGGTEGSRFSAEKLTPYRLRLNAEGCNRERCGVSKPQASMQPTRRQD